MIKKLCKCGCSGNISNRSRGKYVKGHKVLDWKAPENKKCIKCKKILSIDKYYRLINIIIG